MPKVSIAIQPDIFDRFSDLNFKPSQAIAEFVDNAIQSYLDFKNNSTFYYSGYKLIVDINIEWGESADHRTFAKSIKITDNAAGMAIDKFEKAFETGHRPAFNEGLNEYGMGMKTAAFWLSQQWTIISKSFSETTERTLFFDVIDIVENKRTSLDFQERQVKDNKSYTIVCLEQLNQKNNFTKRMLPAIKNELASIYRAFLRRGEIQININNEALLFTEPKLLCAPYFNNPNGENIEWKVQIFKNMYGKEITGFIGILSEMSEKQSGLVILRRGRVIVGESHDHLYHPEVIFGTYKNGFIYKRIYGEIEIKGFSASFNKNGFSNVEALEAMLGNIKSTLKVGGYSLIRQADKLRVNLKQPQQMATITWIFVNGMSDKVEKVPLNSHLAIPTTPTRAGYLFKGWSPIPKTVVKANANYYAQWEAVSLPNPSAKSSSNTSANEEYEVLWVFNNGESDVSEKYNRGDHINIPINSQKEGFSFVKWDPTPISIINDDAIYTAQWKSVASQPQTIAVASREFYYGKTSVRIELFKSEIDAPLLTLNMEKYVEKRLVQGFLNVDILPIANKTSISDDVKNLLLSIAIGMFKAQMSGDDTCDGLMRNI
ncbi:MAG: ATP-binding protein [Prevotella sp.]|nr:ATP-binding protein [Prevotella sp.]